MHDNKKLIISGGLLGFSAGKKEGYKMQLSIVIPIYNTQTEKLSRCFDSICKINGVSFECLLIDDGSKEAIGDFCRDYVSLHTHFRYFKKENGGVSSARNKGIELATGKYICFVDSDDEIEAEAFTSDLISDEYDLIFTDMQLIKKKKSVGWQAFKESGLLSYETVVARMALDGIINGPFCKFIRLDVIREGNIRFDEEMVNGEDAVFLMQLLQRKPRMYYSSSVSYYYHYSLQSGNARIKKFPEKCIKDVWLMFDNGLKCIDAGCFTQEQKNELITRRRAQVIHSLFGFLLDSVRFDILTPELRKQIGDVLQYTEIEKSRYSFANRVRLYSLRREEWMWLRCIAYLREMYLKTRFF